jgi:hypothetical protein
MSLLAPTIERLAMLGANIELTKDSKVLAPTLEKLVSLVASNGGHITIDSSLALAPTLEKLAQIGGKHITIKV